jgi:hypothetical protein
VAVNILNLPGPFNGLLVPSGVGSAPGTLGTFNFAATSRLNQDQGKMRIDRDYTIGGGQNHVSGTFFAGRSDQAAPIFDSSLLFGETFLGNGFADENGNRVLGLNDTHAFSSKLLNQFTIGELG